MPDNLISNSRSALNQDAIGCFDVVFSGPDKYGEIHADLKIPLSLDKKFIYINLSINGGEPIRFNFYYGDAGTMGYAQMKNSYVVNGRLSNVSMNWANPKETDVFRIINAIGILEKGVAGLHLWMKTPETQKVKQ